MGYEIFRGRVAVITGAASGLGRGFAIEIAAAGGIVVAADLDLAGVESAAAEIVARGGRAEAWRLDVRDSAAVTALVDETVRTHGRIDYMFNNAGIATQGPVEEIPLSNWDEIVDINLKGVVYGTVAAYRHMVRQKGGHIVNTASLAGLIPSALLAPYNATKFAVVGLSEALALEARAHGVHVTVLCPGFIESGIYGAARTAGGFDEKSFRENVPFLVPLDRGVRLLLDGVVARRPIVKLPFYAHVLSLVYRLCPPLMRVVGRAMVAKQLSQRRTAAR